MIDDYDKNFTINVNDLDVVAPPAIPNTMLGSITANGGLTTNNTLGTFITTQPHTGSPTNLPYYTTAPSHNYTFTTPNPSSYDLEVKGNASFGGDIKIQGKSISKLLETIEDRLAILQPDPAKLEKYEALRKAYDHYKLMEKLIGEN